MRARLPLAVAAALVAVLLVGCATQVTESAPATSPDHSCPPSGPPPPEGCWQAILPSGSGGYPADPGSENRPLWELGRFPLTLTPHIAYDDQLWMTAQTRAYSSPDGLTWTEHAKTDWGERIYESIIYFKGRLWMYGGLDYQTRTFLNDIWYSPDGRTWSKIGNAAWPARGGHTVVVYHDRLWLFGGANHIAADRSPDGFVNDVWVSDDGISWTRVTRAARGRLATRPVQLSSMTSSTCWADRAPLTYGGVRMVVTGLNCWQAPTGARARTSPGSRTTAGFGCSAAGKTVPPML